MQTRFLFRLLKPFSSLIARQLALPSGWFGGVIMTRALNRGNRKLVEATLDHLSLGPGSSLLDVGFGGGLLLWLARDRGVTTLAGIDPSEVAVDRLRTSLSRVSWSLQLRIERGSVESMPFETGAFDCVASTNTVYFWRDLDAAFAELQRVLRPGGQLAIGFSGRSKLQSFGHITRQGFTFHDEQALVEAALRAGMRDVRLIPLHGEITAGDFVLCARGN